MMVSKKFIKDFAELANRYSWDNNDIDEIKEHIRQNFEPMKKYWSILAEAHRYGYKQTRENGYIRLNEWCHENGFPEFYEFLEKLNSEKNK